MFQENIPPTFEEEAFAEARITIYRGPVVGARATRAGVRAGWSFDGGSLASDGHGVGDRNGVPGTFHAGRVRDARGWLLPDEERRERCRQDTGKPGDRGTTFLGRRLRAGLRSG